MFPRLFVGIPGRTGSNLFPIAYTWISAKKTEGDSASYQSRNIFAGILLVVYTLYLGACATTGINAFWIAFGLLTPGRKWPTRS